MTTSRILPIANLIGCLLITGIIIVQWLKERGTNEKIELLNQQLFTSRDELNSEKARSAALENDISQLKESIESTVQARKESEDALAKIIAEREAQAASEANAPATNQQSILEQTAIWEKALAERDAKIRDLNASLTATRARLDEAVSKLKEAGAR